jgi:hypothetical protein
VVGVKAENQHGEYRFAKRFTPSSRRLHCAGCTCLSQEPNIRTVRSRWLEACTFLGRA